MISTNSPSSSRPNKRNESSTAENIALGVGAAAFAALTVYSLSTGALNRTLDEMAEASRSASRKRKLVRIGNALIDVSKIVSAEETNYCTISLTFEDGTQQSIRTYSPSRDLDKISELRSG